MIKKIIKVFVIGLVGSLVSSALFADIAVIGNVDSATQSLSKDQLVNIYLNKPYNLSSGDTLIPLDQKVDSQSYNAFYENLINWTPDQVATYWSNLTFSGEGNQPQQVPSSLSAISTVVANPAAIAYVDVKLAKAVHAKKLRILAIIKTTPIQSTPINAAPKKPVVKKSVVTKTKKVNYYRSTNRIKPSYKTKYHPLIVRKSVKHNYFRLVSLNENENIWNMMSKNFFLSSSGGQTRVGHEVKMYAKGDHQLVHDLNSARPYLYYIYQQTASRKMPAEIALLPLLESSYDASAKSHSGAMGLWQLMPGTAKDYGVKINSRYDGRKDVVASTNAALDYLGHLHDYFGNWELAVAAYNSGLGCVSRAIKYNKAHGRPTDFWDLPLPQETKLYVPRLLALAKIVGSKNHYGIKIPNVPNKPYFSKVRMTNKMTLSELSQKANATIGSMRVLNPAYHYANSAVESASYVLVPESAVGKFLPLQSRVISGLGGSNGSSIQDASAALHEKAMVESNNPNAQVVLADAQEITPNATKQVDGAVKEGDSAAVSSGSKLKTLLQKVYA